MKLKPCPFCGEDAFLWVHRNGVKVSCKNDCVSMPPRFDCCFTNDEQAIKAWNTRKEGR